MKGTAKHALPTAWRVMDCMTKSRRRAREAAAQDSAAEDTAAQGVVSQDAIAEQEVAQGVVTRIEVSQEEVAQEEVAQDAVILNMPREILLEIMDHLELHDTFHLSHVCRCFRALTKRDWKEAVHQLPRHLQLSFWTGLAFVMPNHWACSLCSKLHKRNPSDAPGWTFPSISDDRDNARAQNRPARCIWEQQQDPPEMIAAPCWMMDHSHLQLAVKLTLRPQDGNASYLERLMQVFERQNYSFASHHLLDMIMTPKIVDGRYLLLVQYVSRLRSNKPISFEKAPPIRVCRHMRIRAPTSAGPYPDSWLARDLGMKGFMDDTYSAFCAPGRAFQGHCRRCMTDYTVVVTGGRLMIDEWHDYGPYGTVHGEEYESQCCGELDTPSTGPTVYHSPGSVRQRYMMATNSS